MLQWFANRTLSEAVFLSLLLLCGNYLFTAFLARYIQKYYKKTGSAELAVYRLQTINKYMSTALLIATMIVEPFLMIPHILSFGEWGRLLSIVLPLLFVAIILLGNQLILHSTNQILRDTTSSRKESVENLSRFLFFTLIPILMMFLFTKFIPQEIQDQLFSGYIMSMVTPMLLIALISVLVSHFHRYMLKATPMPDSDLHRELVLFFQKLNVHKVKLYLWPTSKSRVANALVSGFIQKNIYISDYLIANFTTAELESILAHEIGHIHKKHLWIRLVFAVGAIPFFTFVGEVIEYFAWDISEMGELLMIGVAYLLWFGFLVLYVQRVQERQADAYVLEQGIEPAIYVSALSKLAQLNHTVMRFSRFDETLQTHPSFARRIKWIMSKKDI